jgi:hypothetical protein
MTLTRCYITDTGRPCNEIGHAVLFADTNGPFAGGTYTYGQQIIACLRHANDILDAHHKRRNPTWLTGETWLPKLRLPHHNQVTPTVWGKPRERNRR